MKTPIFSLLSSCLLVLLLLPTSSSASFETQEDFLQCLNLVHPHNSTSMSQVIYNPSNSSFSSVLKYSIANLLFSQPKTPKPLLIITPVHHSQIQTIIICSKRHAMHIRIRSGGHDFEGLSFVSNDPFILLDLNRLRSVKINLTTKTAWVQSGATLGELYYKIAEKSSTIAFPGGIWANVGVGGHFSGGGYGTLRRKYGLAADNVIDAILVDASGRLLDRKSMGEDLFWAIRGGGGSSFGAIISWKIKLVSVPQVVSVFNVVTTLEQGATNIIHKWQYVAPNLHEDLEIRIFVQTISSDSSSREDKRTIQLNFNGLFLGGIEKLVPLMEQNFPVLGLSKKDCSEVSWIESVKFFLALQLEPNDDILLNRNSLPRFFFKGKSDFVTQPISEEGIRGMWEIMLKASPYTTNLMFTPYGGRMSEISESEIPFPHRAGTLYMLYMSTFFSGEGKDEIKWVRSLYSYLGPYVSKFPRASYVNYVDLDLGVNNPHGSTSYAQASVWGKSYFKNNFARLVVVKSVVDPDNFFRHEQSIPTFYNDDGKCEVGYFGDGIRLE